MSDDLKALRALVESTRSHVGKILGGRTCYFGDHTGRTEQFSDRELNVLRDQCSAAEAALGQLADEVARLREEAEEAKELLEETAEISRRATEQVFVVREEAAKAREAGLREAHEIAMKAAAHGQDVIRVIRKVNSLIVSSARERGAL